MILPFDSFTETSIDRLLLQSAAMSSFVLRQDYNELAKTVHSLSGYLTTVFLATRLWAKVTKCKGLWRDDYICKYYPGLGSSHLSSTRTT